MENSYTYHSKRKKNYKRLYYFFSKLVCVASLIFPFSSCMKINTPPKPAIDFSIPDYWQSQKNYSSSEVENDWVKRFKDKYLGLLIKEALRNNKDLQSLSLKMLLMYQNAKISSTFALPQITGVLNSSKNAISRGAFEHNSDIQFQEYSNILESIGLDKKFAENLFGFEDNGYGFKIKDKFNLLFNVQWELDVWKKIKKGIEQLKSQNKVAFYDWHFAQTSLVAQVAKTWFALLESNQQIKIAEYNFNTVKEINNILEEHFKYGKNIIGINIRIQAARAELSSARVEIINRNRIKKSITKQLEALIGNYPNSEFLENFKLSNLPEVPNNPPIGLPSQLLLRRPDILSAKSAFDSAYYGVEKKKTELFPNIQLTSKGGFSTGALKNLVNSNFLLWNIGSNIVQPLFTGHRTEEEVKKEKIIMHQAYLNYLKIVQKAFSEVELSLDANHYLAIQEKELIKLFQQTETLLDDTMETFKNYGGDIVEVIRTRKKLSKIMSLATSLRRLRLENRINLHLALGGGFEIKKNNS